jgi:hypothetical protein
MARTPGIKVLTLGCPGMPTDDVLERNKQNVLAFTI